MKSKVNPEKDMTLNLAISKHVEEKYSQQSEELVASFPAIAINEPSTTSIILNLRKHAFSVQIIAEESSRQHTFLICSHY